MFIISEINGTWVAALQADLNARTAVILHAADSEEEATCEGTKRLAEGIGHMIRVLDVLGMYHVTERALPPQKVMIPIAQDSKWKLEISDLLYNESLKQWEAKEYDHNCRK